MAITVADPVCGCYTGGYIDDNDYNSGLAKGFKDGYDAQIRNQQGRANRFPSNNEYIPLFTYKDIEEIARYRNQQQEYILRLRNKAAELRVTAFNYISIYERYWNAGLKSWYVESYENYLQSDNEAYESVKYRLSDNSVVIDYLSYRLKIWTEFLNNKNTHLIISLGMKSKNVKDVISNYYAEYGSFGSDPVTKAVREWEQRHNAWLTSTAWTDPPTFNAEKVREEIIRTNERNQQNSNAANFPVINGIIKLYDLKPKYLYDTIFKETFRNNSCGWDVGREESEVSSISNGYYNMVSFDTSNWHWFTYDLKKVYYGEQTSEIFGSVKLWPVQGKLSETGIIIMGSGRDFLLFGMDPKKQTYELVVHKNESWNYLIEPTKSNRILQNGANIFSFYLDKGGIVLMVNNYEVNRYNFTNPVLLHNFGPTFGFHLAPKCAINADNFVIIQKR